MNPKPELDDNPWLQVDRRLNLFMLVLLVPILTLQMLRPNSNWMADPTLWLTMALLVLCGLEWWSIRQGQPFEPLRRAIPIQAVLVSTAGLWFNHPNAVMWLPVISFLIFMYLPVRLAQLITATAICAALLILHFHWQVEVVFLLRTLLSTLFIFILLSLFFRANHATASELTETN